MTTEGAKGDDKVGGGRCFFCLIACGLVRCTAAARASRIATGALRLAATVFPHGDLDEFHLKWPAGGIQPGVTGFDEGEIRGYYAVFRSPDESLGERMATAVPPTVLGRIAPAAAGLAWKSLVAPRCPVDRGQGNAGCDNDIGRYQNCTETAAQHNTTRRAAATAGERTSEKHGASLTVLHLIYSAHSRWSTSVCD